jgi:hypothetical protein
VSATGGDAGNITVALSGVSATGSLGTISQTHGGTVALTGVTATSAVGTVTIGDPPSPSEFFTVPATDRWVIIPAAGRGTV